jgi:hypothetical protein
MAKKLKFVKMFTLPCVLVCALRGNQVETEYSTLHMTTLMYSVNTLRMGI